jgi:tellurite methyltransferase
MNGGYDDGYRASPCFWGTEAGSFVKLLSQIVGSFSGIRVLDAGCGEGKNAAHLAMQGATVDAVDVSELAIQNGLRQWADLPGIQWRVGDIREIAIPDEQYDVVVAYGLLHCFPTEQGLREVLAALQNATRTGGYFVLCAFNSRHQDLTAHPGFNPSLVAHKEYLTAFSGWAIVKESDSDLAERHPHNNIQHTHALTRLIARKVSL